MRRLIITALTGIGVLAALFVGVSSTAVVNADGTQVTFGHSKSHVVQNADGSQDVVTDTSAGPTVDLKGKTSLVATGTTTKFRVLGGVGVWNMKIWWDDLGAGASYKTTQITTWNPCTRYNRFQFDVVRNDGSDTFALINCDTAVFPTDATGTSTTKADSDYAEIDGVATNPSGCVYLIPTGGNETGTDCLV